MIPMKNMMVVRELMDTLWDGDHYGKMVKYFFLFILIYFNFLDDIVLHKGQPTGILWHMGTNFTFNTGNNFFVDLLILTY